LLVFPSEEVQVYLWMFRCGNIVLLTTRFLDVAKFVAIHNGRLIGYRIIPVSHPSLSQTSKMADAKVQGWGFWMQMSLNNSWTLSVCNIVDIYTFIYFCPHYS
jgi:hypothetical protein